MSASAPSAQTVGSAAAEAATPGGAVRIIRTSHARIAVRTTPGAGTPLVLLHGPSSSTAEFAPLLASSLGRDRATVAIDLPGHGGSGAAHDPDSSYTLDGYADAVAEVLEHLGIEEVGVLGRSLGAQIGLRMAGTYPGLAGLLVFGGGVGRSAPDAGARDAPPRPRIVSRTDDRYRRVATADRAPTAAELAAAGRATGGNRPFEELPAVPGPCGVPHPASLLPFLERIDRAAPTLALGLCLAG